jgi:hypothetical protein
MAATRVYPTWPTSQRVVVYSARDRGTCDSLFVLTHCVYVCVFVFFALVHRAIRAPKVCHRFAEQQLAHRRDDDTVSRRIRTAGLRAIESANGNGRGQAVDRGDRAFSG